MITVEIPNNFKEEREYIIEVMLGEFLGLEYKIEVRDKKDYIIKLHDGKELIVKDSFFSAFNDGLEYLNVKSLPKKIKFSKNQFIAEDDIPIIYGDSNIVIIRNKIICDIDIFSSSFFMLTRWEEYVNTARDRHDRFPMEESLAYKNGFSHRPIVNEYVEMLWNMLVFLGCKQSRKRREFQLIATHDVDRVYRWGSIAQSIKYFFKDLGKQKKLFCFGLNGEEKVDEANSKKYFPSIETIKDFFLTKTGIKKDPFATFDYLMDMAERFNIKAHFFFMAGGDSSFNRRYSLSIFDFCKLLIRIDERKHKIGFHPSYSSYLDKEQWAKEYKALSLVSPQKVLCGRQHYLRFEVPNTWQTWNDHNMLWDSTLGFAEKESFRCGVCYEYSVYNILTRKKLQVKELPLIVMDGSIVFYQNYPPQEAEVKIREMIFRVKKFKGNFVFLWHNSSFNVAPWQEYEFVYEAVYEVVR